MTRSRRSAALVTVAGSALLVLGTALGQSAAVAAPGGATAATAPAAKSATERVIVVLRDQLSSTPVRKNGMASRTARADSAQNAVLGRLGGVKPRHITHLSVGNAFVATVTGTQAAALAADPAVASVVKDAKIAATPSKPAMPTGASTGPGRTTAAPNADGPNAICPTDPANPLVEPEALNTIHALSSDGSPSAQDLTTGSGVKVAYIADGIDPDNPNFIRPDGVTHAIIDYQDFSGDGPNSPTGGGEAFGDASAIAAQGTVSYDLSSFVNSSYPLPPGCNIRILGVAPGASIVALKAGGEFLTNSSILQSIDYAVRVDHVDVINESFGLNQFPDDSNRNTLKLFNDNAVAAGVTITESTGDGGVTGTIGSDAQDPHVISAGASTDSRLYAQTGYAAARFFGNGRWLDNQISALSSSGFTNFGRTIDLVAPGEADWATCEASPFFASCTNFNGGRSNIQAFGGTSQSAPITAGVAALVISAFRSKHGGASPSPSLLKKFLTGTTTDLGLPSDEQGSGLINARAAVEAAMTYTGSTGAPAGVKSNIITSADQFTVSGTPNTTQSHTVSVKNVGTKKLTVAAGTRTFSSFNGGSQAVAFDSTTLPTFPYPTTGAPWAFKKITFSVPTGTDRLVTQTAWQGSRPPAADAIVRVSLFAPDGTYVANSRPQGGPATANYANVDVRRPTAGTWTAVLYSPAGSAGYTGNVQFATTDQRAVPVGSVTPSTFTLNPGQTTVVTFGYHMPSTASGDKSVAITLASSDGHQTSVSAVIRTVIPTSATTGGDYSGVVTGGNARGTTPGETFSYAFNVPAQWRTLYVSTRFTHNLGSVADLVLIDPNGELSDVVSNETINETETALTLTKDMNSFTAHPVPGMWHLVIVVQNPVSGADLQQPFAGHVSGRTVPADVGGLPNTTSTKLTRNTSTTYKVKVTNPGVQPIFVGVDPRLNTMATLQPVPIQGQLTFALPPDPSKEPTYSIPPDTQSLTVAASSTTPAQLELQGSAAGFDLFGDLTAAQNGDSVSVAKVSESGANNYISRGIWFTNMQEIGPFTDDGAPSGETTITASMRTLAFDPDVSSSTDDPYGNAIDPDNDGFGNPVRIAPGQTKTITVTITPTAAKGTSVSGTLNLVTVPNLPSGSGGLPFTTTGEVVRTLPYAYKVG
jgi:Subtilase family